MDEEKYLPELPREPHWLSSAHSQLQAIVEGAEDAIVSLDLAGHILTWNQAAEAMYGYSRSEIMGADVSCLGSREHGDDSLVFLGQIRAGKRLQHFETIHMRKDGILFPVSLSVSPVQNASGDVVGAAIISRDITERRKNEETLKRLNQDLERHVRERTEELMKANSALKEEIAIRNRTEEELRKAREAAETANQAKSQFIANMSHEMRTPLTAIQGYAEMMYDSKQSVSERLNCIGRIRHHLKNLTELVDDILDLSKVESGKIQICPVTFSLLPELGEIFALLQSQAWKKRLHLEISFEGLIPETVHTDPSRFRQVIMNVITNAVKFTNRGGVNISVKLAPRYDGGFRKWLTFTVVDTGCGISSEQQHELFQPFVQGDGSLTRIYGGTGLGLALSRRVARALNGDVWLAKSQLDRGSTFVIAIDPGDLDNIPLLEGVNKEQMKIRIPAPITAGEHRIDGMRVLLVEDAPDIQILVSHFLKRSGVHVDVAADGGEALRKARMSRYDLVLMDIQMPVLNGYEATAQLHQQGFKGPIVALTAHAMKGMRERCIQAGCDDYLTKPINTSALIELVVRYYHKNKGVA